jgi:protein-tyrosine kinase
MTKVYEVLERADRKQNGFGKETRIYQPPRPAQPSADLPVDEAMIGLYQSIEARLPDVKCKVIQFVSSRRGEGTSTIVREFAGALTARKGKSVLILDADRMNPGQPAFFGVKVEQALEEVAKDDGSLGTAISRVGDSRLAVGLVYRAFQTQASVPDSSQLDKAWEALRREFDLVLIDSPAVTSSTDSLVMCSKVDGVVLVVEAEKTRWPVVNSAKERLVENGANILGAVLNKRQYYIPRSVYSRLG